ncbi:sirohydrochlorin ferrochelatase [Endozoicomonas montiporae]|uniref:Siroheme synthase n=2 Tax=Endozoicomonas montiporae TaxID=1027273 RepID=A0A081NC27_9GAMM|nr:siroheme synthase CysG [Endozoicomonas montiporae]AMO56322.1 siroheme synthase [Endozoicomonas montiporae CL-33]KEQ16000.1 sirohydrochlorin ferrochelatase [Endozoicomonas montiporae]
MDYLPLFLEVRHRRCLIVGGGDIALRKARLLKSAGAHIRMVAPDILPELSELLAEPHHQLEKRWYKTDDLNDVCLVIAATDDKAINTRVAAEANARNLFTNVVDDADTGSAVMPAIVDRSPVMVAFSTGGKAPVLARLLRTRLETLLPAGYGRLAELAGEFRRAVGERFSHINDRRYFWEKVLEGPVAEKALAGDLENAGQLLLDELQASEPAQTGEVYLVGGGPGDPDLLTFKAVRLMQQADVVLHDRLVSEGVLNLCRRDADYIYVGKKRDRHTLPQDDINQLLVEQAKQGKRVLRLKGGDPFIFGRGGEEIDTLAQENIPFQVVPGITAASGCSTYAGIPLTHRDYAQSVRFVTGHLKDDSYSLNWQEMLDPGQTLVFYMGLMGLPRICEELIRHGRAEDTPIALIEQGTTQNQRVFTATLNSIVDELKEKRVRAPTLIIVGDVVRLHEKLRWYQPEKAVV